MGTESKNAWRWKWTLALLNIGVLGMTIALLIAGYEQSFIEKAIGGSTWVDILQHKPIHPFYQQCIGVCCLVTASGFGFTYYC